MSCSRTECSDAAEAPQSPVKHSTTEPLHSLKNYTEGKSLAIYFWDSQFRRNRIFNLIMSKICVHECKSKYILLIAVKSHYIHTHIFIFTFYSNFGGNRLIIRILTLQRTFAKCLDLDQAQHCIGPDLDLNCLTLLLYTCIWPSSVVSQYNLQNLWI